MNEKNIFKKGFFIIFPILFLVGYYYLSNLVYYGIYLLLYNVFQVSMDFFLRYAFIVDAATYIVMIIFLVAFYKWFANRKERCTIAHPIKLSFMMIGVGTGVSGVSYLWIIFLEKFLMNMAVFKNSLEAMEKANDSLNQGSAIGIFLVAVILAPIVEELLFRGIIFNSLQNVKSGWIPIIVSSLLFGVYHMNIVQAVYATLMGIVLALIYQKTKNLLYPILIHMAHNLIGAIQSVLHSEHCISAINVFSMAMILFVFFSIYWVYKKANISEKISGKENMNLKWDK